MEQKRLTHRNNPKIKQYYDTTTIKWMRNKIKPEVISETVNRLMRDREKEDCKIIQIIKEHSKKVFGSPKCQSLVNIREKTEDKRKYDPALFFQKKDLDRVYTLRELFYNYDKEHIGVLEAQDINKMLNTYHPNPVNKNKLNKILNRACSSGNCKMSFSDLVNFSNDTENQRRYLELMKEINCSKINNNDNSKNTSKGEDNFNTERSQYLPLVFDKALQHYKDFTTINNSLKKIESEGALLDKIRNDDANKKKLSLMKTIDLVKDLNYRKVNLNYKQVINIAHRKIDNIYHEPEDIKDRRFKNSIPMTLNPMKKRIMKQLKELKKRTHYSFQNTGSNTNANTLDNRTYKYQTRNGSISNLKSVITTEMTIPGNPFPILHNQESV